MVAVLNDRDQLGVGMPHGVFFRGAAEGEIRKGMLNEDLFEAVIGLPPNLDACFAWRFAEPDGV